MKSPYENAGNVVRRIYDLRIKGPPVLDVATDFPSAELFSSAWKSIRDEALTVAQQMHPMPRFHEVMREQTSISANDGRDWRMFVLKAYGTEFPRNMAVRPKLAAAVAASPEVLSASLSFRAPRKHIPVHRGPFHGVLRFYHLLLSMPLAADNRPAAVLKIGSAEHRLGGLQAHGARGSHHLEEIELNGHVRCSACDAMSLCHRFITCIQIREVASAKKERQLVPYFSKRVAMVLKCLSLPCGLSYDCAPPLGK